MDWSKFQVNGCHRCGAITKCGNSCCRHKSEGPYHHLEEVPQHLKDFYYESPRIEVCEVCNFRINAETSWDMDYDRLVITGRWVNELHPESHKAAILSYEQSFEKHVEPYLDHE